MYAFIHLEKTGGSTMLTILRRSFGTRHCDIRLPLVKRARCHRDERQCVDATDLRRVRRLYRNLLGISGHNVKPYNNLAAAEPALRFFTFLREPTSRFRSHFLNRGKVYSREAFDRWSGETWIHNWQTKMIAGEPSAEKAIELLSTRVGFVGLTQRYDESLLLLKHWLAEPDFRCEYQPVNRLADKSRPRDKLRARTDMSYLDSDAVRERIAAINSEDQKVYDYVTRTLYPRQQAAYPGNLAAEVQSLRDRNAAASRLREPLHASFLRNCIYKPLIHCRVM